MTDRTDGSEALARCIVIAPNQSLTTRMLVGFYGGGLVLSLVVAAALAVFGYWPILVFAVLEWLAIGCCLFVLSRGARYRERVTVTEDVVTVEKRGWKRVEKLDFQRHWARVETEPGRSWYPDRLVITSHGVPCEVGQCLSEDERKVLKRRLYRLIGSTGQAPDLVGL